MSSLTRRAFIATVPFLAACGARGGVSGSQSGSAGEPEVSPLEDLMREHGLLNRMLLVYDECARRLDVGEDPPAAIAETADIIRRFVEGYHERLEEEFLFPRCEGAGVHSDLVTVLRAQHAAGRRVTESILRAADERTPRAELSFAMRSFVRMYRPHEAREDTVLFPAFAQLVPRAEYAELGERFEDREHDLFGEHGFENLVDRVATIERGLGIYDLARFTPR